MPVPRLAWAAVAMARGSTLEERFVAILDGQRNRSAMTMKKLVGSVLVVTAALLPVAALRGQEGPAAAGGATPLENPAVSQQASATQPTTQPTGNRLEDELRARAATRGGRGRGTAGARGGMQIVPASEGPTATLDATVYEVRLPADQIGRFDAEALKNVAGKAEDFEKALAALGTIKPLDRLNQSVRVLGDQMSETTQTPYIASSTITRDGVVNVPNWYSTGATVQLAGTPQAGGKAEMTMMITVSAMTEGTIAVRPGVNAPNFRNARMQYKGVVAPGVPFVVMSVDAASVDADGKAVAYIARVTMGEMRDTAPATAPATVPLPGQR
jgi:hypothetical protein